MRAFVVAVVVSTTAIAGAQPTRDAGAQEPSDATPPRVDPEIEHSMRVASTLAKDGHCDVALEYGKQIEAQAPDYYVRVFVADRNIAACIAGTAPPPAQPPASTQPGEPEPDDEAELARAACRRVRLYAAPSLFFMRGSMYTNDSGGTESTSGEATFHRVAVGARVMKSCAQPYGLGGHVAATVVLNSVIAGFGAEAEVDHGAGVNTGLRGGLRLGAEFGGNERIFTAGARVHLFETVFLGLDGYTARDGGYRSHGVMFGVGLEGRAGRWIAAIEGAVATIALLVVITGIAGPP